MIRLNATVAIALLLLQFASICIGCSSQSVSDQEEVERKKEIRSLTRDLKSDVTTRREIAAGELGAYGQEAASAVPELIKLVKGEYDWMVKSAAISSLGQIKDGDGVVEALTYCLKDSREEVCISAAEALSELGPKAKEAVPALTELLQNSSSKLKAAVIETLASIGPDAIESVPSLMKVFEDEANLRAKVSGALGAIGPGAQKAELLLLDALTDKDPYTRMAAAKALGEIGANSEDVVNRLIELLDDEDSRMRIAAILGLKGIGPKAKDALSRLYEFANFDAYLEEYNGYTAREAAIEAIEAIEGIPLRGDLEKNNSDSKD